jgi:hypothetical protein
MVCYTGSRLENPKPRVLHAHTRYASMFNGATLKASSPSLPSVSTINFTQIILLERVSHSNNFLHKPNSITHPHNLAPTFLTPDILADRLDEF